MAHPYHQHRSHIVEKERAHKVAGGRLAYARGGGVHKEESGHSVGEEDDSFETDRAVASDHIHKRERHLQTAHPSRKGGGHVEGKKAKHRLDRHNRKRGGAAKHPDEKEDRALVKRMLKEHDRDHRASGGRNHKKGGKHVTNVIVAPQGGNDKPVPVPVPSGGPPPAMAMPPRPPMGPPPGAPPMMGGPPGAGAGPMPPVRKAGGRIGVRNQGPGDPHVGEPPGKKESKKHETPVQHTDGKADTGDIGRPKPVTFKRGGKVTGVSVAIPQVRSGEARDHTSKAVPQLGKPPNVTSVPVAPRAAASKPNFHGGSKSGVGRLEKIAAEKRNYP
jgi:hypothetical protein